MTNPKIEALRAKLLARARELASKATPADLGKLQGPAIIPCPCSDPDPHDARESHPGEDRARGLARLEAMNPTPELTLEDWS